MSEKRRRYTAKQKVKILRDFLENDVSASEIAERYGIHPSHILRWQKLLFEGAVQTFPTGTAKKQANERRKRQQLQDKLKRAQELVIELTLENLRLPKSGSAASGCPTATMGKSLVPSGWHRGRWKRS